MMRAATLLFSAERHWPRDRGGTCVEVGSVPILLRSNDVTFGEMLNRRYAGFLNPSAEPGYEFEVHLHSPSLNVVDRGADVSRNGTRWCLERGDFYAEWDVLTRRGWICQPPSPYAIDSVLRIVHSLALAEEGGFLVHAASVVREGRAFLFAGVSGSGKTTMSGLAPADATVLTDEISYIRRCESRYRSWGTPFAGELARVGANISAPLDTLFLLAHGPLNLVKAVDEVTAARELMRHILFFAHDPEFVRRVFYSALEFVSRVKIARLVFAPDERVWDLVR